MKYIFIVLISFFLLSSATAGRMPWSDGRSKAEDLSIKLVTFGPGDDIPSWWGHTALLVEDTTFGLSRLYNYGLYSLGPDMLKKFAFGRLIFSSGSFRVPSYYNFYIKQNRDVRILTLTLQPHKKLWLAEKLARDILPENREYLYHHYYDNCSTRLRDLLNTATDSLLFKQADRAARTTLRGHTKRYVGHSFPMEMLLMFLMNKSIDQPIQQWDEMFLPDELENGILALSYSDSLNRNIQLVSESDTLFKALRAKPPTGVPDHWVYAFLSGSVLAFLAWLFTLVALNQKSFWAILLFSAQHSIAGILISILGLALTFMAFFTDHTVTHYNINLLLANPFSLLAVYYGLRSHSKKKQVVARLQTVWLIHLFAALLLLVTKAIGLYLQDNLLILSFVVPLFMGLWFSSRLFLKAQP